MKMVISPSKTMQKTIQTPSQNGVFNKQKQHLVSLLQAMPLSVLQKTLHVSEKLAKETYLNYQAFEESHCALFSYTGAQFKAIDVGTLAQNEIDFLNDHLRILSGLYGVVRPKDAVALYRLPMGLKLNDVALNAFWKEPLKGVFGYETILNLASLEYASCLDESLEVITVVFKAAPSMQVKKLRGLMVRHIAKQQSLDRDTVKAFEADGYRFDATESNQTTIVFAK